MIVIVSAAGAHILTYAAAGHGLAQLSRCSATTAHGRRWAARGIVPAVDNPRALYIVDPCASIYTIWPLASGAGWAEAAGRCQRPASAGRLGMLAAAAALALHAALLGSHYYPLLGDTDFRRPTISAAAPAPAAAAAECTADWQTLADPAVRACCRYQVTRQPVTALRGAVPDYVNATLYHAVFVTNLTDDYPGAGTVGALLSVDFSQRPLPLVSFRYNEGTKFAAMCNVTPPVAWAPSNAVTVNLINGSALVVASAVPNLVNRFDSSTLAPLAAPYAVQDEGCDHEHKQSPQHFDFDKDASDRLHVFSVASRAHRSAPDIREYTSTLHSLITRGILLTGCTRFSRQFFGPGHQPADANGNVYGYVRTHAHASPTANFVMNG